MGKRLHLIRGLAAIRLFALTTLQVWAAYPVPPLVPGGSTTLAFPELPATYYDLAMKRGADACLTVTLPSNYDPARQHPLLIFLGGGDGGPATNPAVARALTQGRDYVCVAMPLFKVTDPHGPGGEIIMRDADAKYMWPFFRTMLARVEALVPNLDPAHRVLGGFSNGAHATQGLIDQSDGEIAQRFSAFVFVEGGGRLQHYELLKGRPFLMVSSNAKSRPRAEAICADAKAAGALTTLVFEDVGKHDFPASAYPAVREWLRGPALR
jgi:hypothetical protein